MAHEPQHLPGTPGGATPTPQIDQVNPNDIANDAALHADAVHDPKTPLDGTVVVDGGAIHGPVIGVNSGNVVTNFYHNVVERLHPLVITLLVLTVVTALATQVVVGSPKLDDFTTWLYSRGWLSSFPVEQPGETLIMVVPFYRSEGVTDVEAYHQIHDAIQDAVKDMSLSDVRVEVARSSPLRAEDRARAERLANRYRASIIIWGADTGIEVTINYLNLRQPDFDASDVTINETERTQIANPSAYSRFLTKDLRNQMTFLSLFAVGQSAYIRGEHEQATRIIERATSVLSGDAAIEGTEDAYFRLGWLYQETGANPTSAITAYDQAIELKPDYAIAYYNRGNARFDQGDLDSAIADFDQAIKLNPNDADAYNNRGLARFDQGDLDGAIADYDQAIKLKPDYATAYYNRGNARKAQGDLDGAIADYDQAIKLNPNDAEAYYYRGLAYEALNDKLAAEQDFQQAFNLGYTQAKDKLRQ